MDFPESHVEEILIKQEQSGPTPSTSRDDQQGLIVIAPLPDEDDVNKAEKQVVDIEEEQKQMVSLLLFAILKRLQPQNVLTS